MSIKVGVRVRPFNGREKDRESVCVIDMNGPQTIIRDDLEGEKIFTFDHSFWSHDSFTPNEKGYFEPDGDKYADQNLVFNSVGKEILDNAWEGYHCCLFAYGQTGSGKSYSMVGYGANKGIVPISCEEIFTRIKSNDNPEKSYEVQVSMLEIYNEKVQDLLVPMNKRPQSGLKVRESKVLGIFVEGLTKYPVTSYEEISKKMDEGYENRTIGSTAMNATSSRAHTIVTIEFKQIQAIAGKKGEKLSMINLVDLAGSERAGSTGATGDRLKEGCNINKSLLVLGNVINTLADKATGKKKDMLPPYRDSALTRILQNALGGNSKTVMICALSPASINYEETLSTLRYADRAKKIQNKAVINESEHDKMIRCLKEENGDLKKMIEDLEKKIMGGGGSLASSEDNAEFQNLKEQYAANQQVFEDMQKTFSEKIEEAKIKDKETLGEKVDINLPHLVVLNEDPQLSHKLRYSLAKLPVYVGRKHGNPTPQVTLSGIGIKQNHAVFFKEKDDIVLKANDKESKDYIFINGKMIADQGVVLHQKDRITFGTNTIVIFMKNSNGNDIFDIDWESSQLELQKELEENTKRQEEDNEKKKQEEFNVLKKDLEERYLLEKSEIEEKLKEQVELYQTKLKEISQTTEKVRIETERINAVKLLKQKIDMIEMEKAKKRREVELRERNEKFRKSTMKMNNSEDSKGEKIEQTLMNILKKLSKMKIIISELKRNINLEVFVAKNLFDNILLSRNSSTSMSPAIAVSATVLIRVENYEEGTVYYWSPETFYNRYDLMKDLFDRFSDEDEVDILNLKTQDDPLWDEAKPSLLGYALYKLEPMGYLLRNFSTLSIISPNGIIVGELDVDVIPHDEQGQEFEEVPDQPEDLIGQSLLYKVYIKELRELPDNFCKKLYVEYDYDSSMTNRTNCYNNSEDNHERENTTTISIEESFEHKIDYLSKDDIDYFNKESIVFKVYAYERVEKKGKISKEEFNSNSINYPIKVNEELLKTTVSNDFFSEPKGEGRNDELFVETRPSQVVYESTKIDKKDRIDRMKKEDCIIY